MARINALKEAKKLLAIDIEQLTGVKNRLNESFQKAVELLLKCKGKVVVTGMGKSGLVAHKIASTMSSMGTPALFLHPSEGMHGDIGIIKKEDVVIVLSNSGESEEITCMIPSIKRIGSKIVALTGNKYSSLGKGADVVIDVKVSKEACPLNIAPTASTLVALAIGDVMSAVVARIKGFREEEYALYHPGGLIGKRMLLEVRDVMSKGEDLPKCGISSSVDKLLVEMVHKNKGCVCVTGSSGRVAGIVTDGDIKRIMLKYKGKIFDLKAADIMTKNPVSVEMREKAVKALEIMRNRKKHIHVLPVTDKGKLAGVVQVHDIIALGG